MKFTGFRPWVLHRGRVLDHEGVPLDDVLAVFMPGPRTFTGEDVAEIHCHGGPFIVQAVLETALRLGARAELIAAPSREALRYSLNRLDGLLGRKVTALRRQLEGLRVQMSLAVDFPDEEVECLAPEAFAAVVEEVAAAVRGLLTGQRRVQVMQQGAVVVLAGAVNAGKSSLLNALLGRNRALVTDIPGTTRDFLEEGCQPDRYGGPARDRRERGGDGRGPEPPEGAPGRRHPAAGGRRPSGPCRGRCRHLPRRGRARSAVPVRGYPRAAGLEQGGPGRARRVAPCLGP